MTASGPEGETGAHAAGRPASTSEPAPAGAGQAADAIPDDPQALTEDIERTREQLGDTVEALTAKFDAKAQAQAKAAQLKNGVAGVTGRVADQITAKASPLRQQLAGKSGDLAKAAAGGRAKAAQLTPEPARRATARAARTARERPLPYAAAAGAAAVLLIGWLAWRRRRR